MDEDKHPALQNAKQLQRIKEDILSLNSITSAYGLSLTPEDVADILEARQMQQKDYGVLETSPASIESIITKICSSAFVNSDTYPQLIIDFEELYYYLVALLEEAEPEIAFKLDTEYVISFLKKLFEESGGYMDAVRGKIERFFANFEVVGDKTVEFVPLPQDDNGIHVVNPEEEENTNGGEGQNG